jgi:predicted HAD superfamily hydrolase
MIAEHKEGKTEEPPVVSKKTVTDVLEYCGVAEEKITEFKEKYDHGFGTDAQLSPKNIIDVKKFEMKTPDITIRVNPERLDLVKTQIINGQKYILIRADENVEVNGVNINITQQE